MTAVHGPVRLAPGRLGDPGATLGTDPRSDPRMVAALAPFGLDGRAAAAPVGVDDPLEARLAHVAAVEEGFEAVFAAMVADLPPVEGVTRETEVIAGPGGDLVLHISRPSSAPPRELPGVLHVHGGGMAMLSAEGPAYVRLRDELAAAGLVVIGVAFRNAGGRQGAHPFPAGLDDCTAALEWAHSSRERLGLSSLVLVGESGGANLALATALRAKREGRLDRIDGVFAMVPFISGGYGWPAERKAAELPSLLENDGYLVDSSGDAVTASVYDPDGSHAEDPLAWPYFAQHSDLEGLPPHVVTVDELDPFRDEGLAYARALARAGVAVTGHTNTGVCHAGELIFRRTMPELYLSTIAAVAAFAQRVARRP